MERVGSGLGSADSRIGKYTLRNVIARTALSVVYDGWDMAIARRVAIKMMRLSLIDDEDGREALVRFRRGAQAAGQLNHPNIVSVYDYGETDQYAYIVMEFVDGPTLKTMLDGNQRLAFADVSKLMTGILDALQYSHDRKIVHRDIKPANVMFTKENIVKITDFGIARIDNSDLTQMGMVIGTPAYMAPEQFMSEAVDQRTDIYSAGVLLYHVLTGERPFGGTVATIMHKVLHGVPLLPSKLSTAVTPDLDRVVAKAMAKDPQNRFQSAAEFKAELTKALKMPEVSRASSLKPSEPAREKIRISMSHPPRRSLILAAVLLAVTFAGGAIGWRILGRSPTSPAADIANAPSETRVTALSGASNQGVPSAEKADPDGAAALPPAGAPRADAAPGVDRGGADSTSRVLRNDMIEASPLAALEAPPAAPGISGALPPSLAGTSLAAPEPADSSLSKAPNKRLPPPGSPTNYNTHNAKTPSATGPEQHYKLSDVTPKADVTPRADLTPKVEEDHVGALMDRLHARYPGKAEEPDDHSFGPSAYPVTSSSPAIGLLCQSVTSDSAAALGLNSAQGMVVLGVTSGLAAASAGILPNDVILTVNGKDIGNLTELPKIAATIPAGQFVSVDILRKREHHVVRLSLDKLRS